MPGWRAVLPLVVLLSVGVGQAQQGWEVPSPSPALLMAAGAAFSKEAPPLRACPAKFEDSLESDGIAPEGKGAGVKQPKPISIPEAEFSEKARKEINKKHLRPFFSVSTIVFVVDKDGNPRDLCVKKSAEFDLDEEAAKAVMRYRFEPATKDGDPVAMRITTEISFAIR